MSTPPVVEVFIPVMQRRSLKADVRVLSLIEPLFLIETHMSFEERLTLLQAAMGLPNSFVACEVGSYLGASAGFLAAAAALKGGRVHCVDTWGNEAMGAEPLEDTFARFCANTHTLRHFIVTHRGPSAEMAGRIPDQLDLLFIDGDHSYEGAKSDLTHYVPKLKPGGLLVMHDYHTWETVHRAGEDFFAGRPRVDRGRAHSLQMFQLPG